MTRTEIKLSNLSLAEIANMMSELQCENIDRKFIVQTGAAGAAIFHLEMRRYAIHTQLKTCLEYGLVTMSEYIRFGEMIDSPDYDNMTVVECILETRLGEKENTRDGSNI